MDSATTGQDGIERHVEHTAKAYDSLPYISRPIFRTHPARIAAVARLFGLDPAPPAGARVLELGCAAGGNLIPLAARYPEARFVGIDLGQRMIEDGQARIAALGLGNIELRVESITDFGADNGSFDYIVCHGVYSWVPAPVREAILAICEHHLSPNGIAYISYNVLPGWRVFQPIRDAMRILPNTIGESARAQQGRALLGFLSQASPEEGIWRELLGRALPLIGDNDTYLYHEFMEEVNDPSMFIDFVAAADRHDLGYLGETELSVMFPQAHGDDFAAKVGGVTDGIVQQQQMIDLLVGTAFRHSLLVRRPLADHLDRANLAARLPSLFVTGSGFHRCERDGAGRVTLIAGGDKQRIYDDPVAVALLDRLFGPVPGSLSLETWIEGLDADEQTFSALVSEWITSGVVALVTEPLGAAAVSERPLADALVRTDAALGRSETSSLLHSAVALTDEIRLLLPHLDGTRTHADLADLVVASAAEGKIAWRGADGQELSRTELASQARAIVASSLDAIARLGLLTA